MNWGHIICLNGVTSSGKTSIAKEIQDVSEQNYYHVSLDMFEQMANLKYRIKAYYAEMNDCISVMYETIASFAKLGKNVVLDTVLLDIPEFPSVYERLIEACKEIQIFNIHIICPIDECEKRNIVRGDRRLGLSEWHSERMVEIPYFFEIDTLNKSSRECATEILSKVEYKK
jgi:chloramphenicol 3-O-phosphotransferase